MMPGGFVLREGYPFALDGVGDEARRFSLFDGRRSKRFEQGGVVVSVKFFHCESKRDPTLGKGFHADGVLGEVPLLDSIPVDNYGQVIEIVVLRAHGRFPVRTLLEFSV